jgi:hypothetical protein
VTARVLPTEPGWWWVSYRGAPPQVTQAYEAEGKIRARYGMMSFHAEHVSLEWLEPVAPPGTVARLEAERDEARRNVEALRERLATAERALFGGAP